jgi:hypothetical protein
MCRRRCRGRRAQSVFTRTQVGNAVPCGGALPEKPVDGEIDEVRMVRNRLERGRVTSALMKEADCVSRTLVSTGRVVTVQKTAIYSRVKV